MFKFHEFVLLDSNNAVELSDVNDQLWVKESKVISAATKSGTRTMSHWRKRDIENDLTGDARLTYDALIQAECGSTAPDAEYEFTHEDVVHRLQKYPTHMVYHVKVPKLQLERVVIAKDEDAMVNHSYGIGGLYYRLVTDLS
jgi:hypothetical protein